MKNGAQKRGSRLAEADGPVQRMLGRAAITVSQQQRAVNAAVRIESWALSCDENDLPEEQGRLVVMPQDEGLAMQILYLEGCEKDETSALVYCLHLDPPFMMQWEGLLSETRGLLEEDRSADAELGRCSKLRALMLSLAQKKNQTDSLSESLQETGLVLQMLERALELVRMPQFVCPVPACRFLAHEAEREKVWEAKRLLETDPERPLTIKELSLKVGINQCYLKKGFKALTGKTVHEFQHQRRIARAEKMLREEQRSVTDVAFSLGFTSISHFSTAFKKTTGLKPCELLG